ncbi:MAG: multicopper oxidase domain-containing protein [Deltaproteobacteria bacterium]|nr:multicopper oxidase domain-containing protein [Deltaproteobacteria bacterium]
MGGVYAAPTPGQVPDYFGVYPNYATSPLPRLDGGGNPIPGTGMRKFIDGLPGLGEANQNNLGQYLPVAVKDVVTYPDADYYEIAAVQFFEQMHTDLPPTQLRGYVQLETPQNAATSKHIPLGGGYFGYDNPHYLGPIIAATKDHPVRIKFRNLLPSGAGGNLFIPTDTTYMGAGLGPDGVTMYTQNRVSTHLHGGHTPWISDGTPHQWVTPADEVTPYPKGASVAYVPDMDGGVEPAGTYTFYYTNQQSARLMFYHDHALGITRLNVYAGMVAGYLVTDPTEQALIANGTFPADSIPLLIQDKTYVPDNTTPFTNSVGTFASQLEAQDPTWDTAAWGGFGQLWFPHVYMPNQNPYDISGANAMGRWDYGAWFWPPFTGLVYGPIANPYFGQPGQPEYIPGTPDARLISPSGVPESFMDTPVINGTAYPYLNVDPKPYRFRILNGANDRFWNLSLWVADNTGYISPVSGKPTEVKMVPFNSAQNGITPFPEWWYSVGIPFSLDDRVGGVPDPTTRGPAMVQVATEGGILPAPAVILNQPVNYTYDRRNIVILNVEQKALFLGPAERAEVIVDFAPFAGKTLILYNDSPAPVPAGDPRQDYYTNSPDLTDTGGAPSIQPGYGPNTRTIMQIRVGGSGGPGGVDYVNPTILSKLQTNLPPAFAASQHPIIVPQEVYNPVYGTTVVDAPGKNFGTIQTTTMTFTPIGQTNELTMEMNPKAIIEDFTVDFGRMNAILGVELPHTNVTNQTSIIQGYIDPPTEIIKLTSVTNPPPIGEAADGTQIWKITHNGVDTHSIHFHLADVQLVNRVGWDGAIYKPDPNESGWKDTIRMNPLEDVIVAHRPFDLRNLPFKVKNSVRLLDPTMPEGDPSTFINVNPLGNPVTVTNHMVNYGWEYVWHCHLLGHEENDMMRALAIAAPPDDPSNCSVAITGTGASRKAVVNWHDNSINETKFVIQRATNSNFTGNLTTFSVGANTTGYVDTVGSNVPNFYYRVRADNVVGDTTTGYERITASSGFSNGANALGTFGLKRMYRVYNPNLFQHVFTTDVKERNALVSLGWRDESTPIPFQVINSNASGSQRVFRLYNPSTGAHYLTLRAGERAALLALGWLSERSQGYLFPGTVLGASRVFTLYEMNIGDHVYTANANERAWILTNLPTWQAQSDLGYGFR